MECGACRRNDATYMATPHIDCHAMQRITLKPRDWRKVAIHKFLDQSKLYLADWRHRALLHTTFGVALCEQFFGDLYKRASDGGTVATRTVAEVHILEDMRAILTPADFLREMPIRSWMNGLTASQRRAAQSFRIPEIEGSPGTIFLSQSSIPAQPEEGHP